MKSAIKLHRAWIILLVMVLVYSGMVGIILNCIGVLFSAILDDMGFRAGDLSVFHTIRSLSSAIVMTVTVKWFLKYNTRVILAILASLACGGVAMMALFDHLWQWYVAAVLVGVGTSCILVVGPIVLNNWFHKNNGLAIGLTTAASGLTGAIFSPILSGIIEALGWRLAAVIMGLVGFILIVPASALLLEASPDKIGLKPYGTKNMRVSISGNRQMVPQPGSCIFVLCVISAIAATNLVNFVNQLPTFALSVGYALEVGAMLTSCCMVGNLAGKLIFGVLVDKIGIYHSDRIYVSVVFCAMLMFLLFNQNEMVLYVAAALFGCCYAVSNMSISLLFLDVYGTQTYGKQLSRAQAINNAIAAFLASAIPYLYDATGSFDLALICCMTTMILSFVIYTYLRAYTKKRDAYIQDKQKRSLHE